MRAPRSCCSKLSIAGRTEPVPNPFLVLATQNPIESECVYPLPEAQRDRQVKPCGREPRDERGGRDDAHHIELRLELAQRFERAEYGRRPGHVELHVLHVLRGLDRDPAGIERDALADERDGSGVSAPAAVLEHDEARLLRAPLRHGEERAKAFLLQLCPKERSLGGCISVLNLYWK